MTALEPSRVRGLVFDLDGTLIDSYGAIAESLNHARLAFGLQSLPEETVRAHVGRGLEHLVADLVGADRIEEGVRLFRESYAKVFSGLTRILPGVRETLTVLRRSGYRMSVASNKPARFAEPILETLGVRDCVGAILGPDLAGCTKPDPAMIRLCLASMGTPPREAAYVGDMVLDVESADRAGVPVILVPGGSSSAEELRSTGRTVLGSFRGLLDLFRPVPG
jgi:phosphoglycolate phosphatase